MPDYRVQLWRKIPNTNTTWTPVIELEFTEADDENAVNDVVGSIPRESITVQRQKRSGDGNAYGNQR